MSHTWSNPTISRSLRSCVHVCAISNDIYMYIYMCLCVCVSLCELERKRLYMCACEFACTCTYKYKCAYKSICRYTYAYIYKHIGTHRYIIVLFWEVWRRFLSNHQRILCRTFRGKRSAREGVMSGLMRGASRSLGRVGAAAASPLTASFAAMSMGPVSARVGAVVAVRAMSYFSGSHYDNDTMRNAKNPHLPKVWMLSVHFLSIENSPALFVHVHVCATSRVSRSSPCMYTGWRRGRSGCANLRHVAH